MDYSSLLDLFTKTNPIGMPRLSYSVRRALHEYEMSHPPASYGDALGVSWAYNQESSVSTALNGAALCDECLRMIPVLDILDAYSACVPMGLVG